MAKKVYAPGVNELASLKPINSRLSYHCNVYALSGDIVWIHSLIPFVEKVALLKNPESVAFYSNIMVNAVEFRSFLGKFRKTFTEVTEERDGFYIKDTKSDESTFISKLGQGEANIQQISSMYRHLLHDNDAIGDAILKAVDTFDSNDYQWMPTQDIIDLQQNKVINFYSPLGNRVYLTKSIFGTLNGVSAIGIRDLPIISDTKRYLLLVQEYGSEAMLLFTALAVLPI